MKNFNELWMVMMPLLICTMMLFWNGLDKNILMMLIVLKDGRIEQTEGGIQSASICWWSGIDLHWKKHFAAIFTQL